MGEGKSGIKAYLGAALSRDKSEAAWISLLESLEIPEAGKGLLVIHDGDPAIASALSFILPKAKRRICVWHKLTTSSSRQEQFPNDLCRVKEIVNVAKTNMETPEPRTTAPLERAIREYRRRTRPMDGFKSLKGAANFLQIWLAKENAGDGKGRSA